MIKIAIVEDELPEQDMLIQNLKRYEKEKNEAFAIRTFINGFDFLESYRSNYDIVFMDIEMPDMNGMKTAQKLREMDKDVCLLFVTKSMKYAIKGYELCAMYYVLKPIKYYSFAAKLENAVKAIKKKEVSIAVKSTAGFRSVGVNDILYIEVQKNTVKYHTYREVICETNTLKNVESVLKNYGFVKCNKGYLVNLRHVGRIDKDDVYIGDECLQISRTHKKDFINAFTSFTEWSRVTGGGYRK